MNLKVPIIITGVSLLLNVVGLAIPYWLYISAGEAVANVGLWQVCGSTSAASACIGITSSTVGSAFQATRALEILGMLLLMGVLVCAFLKLLVMKEQGLLPKVAGGCAIAAGLLIIIGCIIFATKFKEDFFPTYDLHAGFALCIVAGIGSIVAAVFFFMSKDN